MREFITLWSWSWSWSCSAKVVFGLNALNGRVPLPDGSMGGPWDYTNAASLIRYTANKGYRIHGWELGTFVLLECIRMFSEKG
jgi:hypothetical protein